MQEIIRIDLNGVNCYLGKQEGQFILFDTGGHIVLDKQFDNRYELLIKQLKEHGCTPDNLNLIVLTHGDNDHVANAWALKKQYGARIAMHQGDRELVEKPNITMVMDTFHYRSTIFRIVMKFMKNKIRGVMLKVLDDYKCFTPDILLVDGDSLAEYGFDGQVLHLPGHTPGSIAVLTPGGAFAEYVHL